MRPDDNKTELFQMICCTLSKIHCPTQIVTIENSDVKSNCNIDTKNLQLCNHEEADSRMVVHLIDASKRWVKRVLVATVDTDVVVVVLIYLFFFLQVWSTVGWNGRRSTHLRWLPIHTYAQLLTNEVCQGFPFLYAVTGCDTVTMFSVHAKKTAWKVWKPFSEARSTLARFQWKIPTYLPTYLPIYLSIYSDKVFESFWFAPYVTTS